MTAEGRELIPVRAIAAADSAETTLPWIVFFIGYIPSRNNLIVLRRDHCGINVQFVHCGARVSFTSQKNSIIWNNLIPV